MDNFNRMIHLVDEFFATKNDPSQLTITEEVIDQLRSIHPATMGEFTYGDGPIAWTINIPTTIAIREQFVNGEIGETELMKQTLIEKNSILFISAPYWCSPNFAGKDSQKNWSAIPSS